MDLLSFFSSSDIISQIVIVILGLSTIVGVIESVGAMPSYFSKKLAKNRLTITIEVLKEMGINFNEERRFRLLRKIPTFFYKKPDLNTTIENLIKKHIKKGVFSVGKTRQLPLEGFVDLMSGSCNPEDANLIARCLSTHWANSSQGNYKFDFVATPKSGSPFIGYEFAKILDKKIVLHDCNEAKYHTKNPKYEQLSHIDSSFEIKSGMIALIVDDSTTGGRKVRELAKSLRALGCTVDHCLVAFAPQGKLAEEHLSSHQITLHSIVKRNE